MQIKANDLRSTVRFRTGRELTVGDTGLPVASIHRPTNASKKINQIQVIKDGS